MVKMFKDDKSCTAASSQIPAMEVAGWTTKKPKPKVEKVEKKAKKITKKVTNRLVTGTK